MPVEEEVGSLPAQDNGFSQYLLSLLRAAVHPTDKWAIGHLKMCPFMKDDSDTLDAILEEVRKKVYESGFAAFVRQWGEQALEEVDQEAQPFIRTRLSEILNMAQSFDQNGSRNIDLFIDFARRAEASKGAMESSIRAMTIHGSKGLTFDMVIMPDLGGGSLNNTGGFRSENGIELYKSLAKSGLGFDWVLAKPKKFLQEADPFLSCMLTSDEEASAFESLCKFYVGMTRPARALYLFSEPYNPNSSSKNFIYLLSDTLSMDSTIEQEVIDKTNHLIGQRESGFELAYCSGSPEWWLEREVSSSQRERREVFDHRNFGKRKYRNLSKSKPSDKEQGGLEAGELLGVQANTGKEIGTEVHSLFEKLKWWDEKTNLSNWLDQKGTGISKQAMDIFSRAMVAPEVMKIFSLPAQKSEVWMERSFVYQKEGKMVQGIFDRVVLSLSESDQIMAAEIIDFKTDRPGKDVGLDQLVDRYRGQLESYRSALVRLTGLPENKIRMTLLFTSIPQIFSWE
jgi:ATP-dependent exoDNAse (exonuclease V) beta subunit